MLKTTKRLLLIAFLVVGCTSGTALTATAQGRNPLDQTVTQQGQNKRTTFIVILRKDKETKRERIVAGSKAIAKARAQRKFPDWKVVRVQEKEER